MDWNDVPLFLAVYRSGSLTQAAKDLSVATTTVGRRIAALEESLGQALFARSPEGYHPTAYAHQLAVLAGDVERPMLTLERKAVAAGAAVGGRVRVATLDIIAERLLSTAVPRLLAAHPDLSLELVGVLKEVSLARREAEILLRTAKPEGSSLIARKVGQVKLGLYASIDYLKARGAPSGPDFRLEGHALVGLEERLDFKAEMKWMRQRCHEPRFVLRTSNVAIIEQAIADGVGIGVLPTRFAADNRRLRCITDEVDTRTVWLVVHADMREVPSVRVTMDWIADALAPLRA